MQIKHQYEAFLGYWAKLECGLHNPFVCDAVCVVNHHPLALLPLLRVFCICPQGDNTRTRDYIASAQDIGNCFEHCFHWTFMFQVLVLILASKADYTGVHDVDVLWNACRHMSQLDPFEATSHHFGTTLTRSQSPCRSSASACGCSWHTIHPWFSTSTWCTMCIHSPPTYGAYVESIGMIVRSGANLGALMLVAFLSFGGVFALLENAQMHQGAVLCPHAYLTPESSGL